MFDTILQIQNEADILRQIMQEEMAMYKWIAGALGALCCSLAAFLWNSEKKQTARIMQKLEANDRRFEEQLQIQKVAIRILAKETGVDITHIMPEVA